MTQTEEPPLSDIKHLACQTAITARIERKGLFSALSNWSRVPSRNRYEPRPMLFRSKPRLPHSGIRALFRWIYDTFSSEDRRSVSSNESWTERYRDQNQHADKCAVCECLSVVWQMKHEK
jgi:hypothetical protein